MNCLSIGPPLCSRTNRFIDFKSSDVETLIELLGFMECYSFIIIGILITNKAVLQ